MSMQMKPDNTPEGALVYSDWLQDHNHPETEWQRWQFISWLQNRLQAAWELYGGYWSATELRTLPMSRRTKHIEFIWSGKTFLLSLWFAQREVIITAREMVNGKWSIIGETSVRRSTIAKHGKVKAFRDASLRITEPKE